MSIKIALLKSGENVISDAKELVQEDKVRGYLFKKPHVVDVLPPDHTQLLTENEGEEYPDSTELKVSLSPWIMLSKDEEIPVPPDWIVAIVEPIETIVEMYKEKTDDN